MRCPGTIVVDTSSSSPLDTQSLGVELKEFGVTLVDAPITQLRVHAIETGDATIMVGSGSREAVDKITPVLRAMGKKIVHTGRLGHGTRYEDFQQLLQCCRHHGYR
jgi:3-hydroxyisobutyrate dehydrogenase-like beta-hydroxyacid dehydrogenase